MAVESDLITTISPSTNQPIISRSPLSAEQLAQLPVTATTAFQTYCSKYSLSERQKIVTKALQLIIARENDLARGLTEQMGRPIKYAEVEIRTAAKRAEYLLRISEDCLKDTEGEPEEGYKRYIKKLGVGVVLILFAWNYPYLILVNSLIPALLAGNAVIIKPSPQTPTIAEDVKAIFEEAGLPKDVIQYVHCGNVTQLEPLIRSPLVNLICFTGSVAGGLQVQKIAAGRVVPVGLELGGKDPAYVRADVDTAWAAEQIVDGAMFNSGQSCCSIERVYVAEEVYDDFVKAAQRELKSYELGDPSDVQTTTGPVISKKALETIGAHIKDALTKGAKDVTPPNATFEKPPPSGNYIKPTLLTDVNHDMLVMTEETFGPVMPIMKVKNDDEAIGLMNDSEFGLTASIWTGSVAKGEQLANLIEAGTVFVNRADYPSPDLAWTGWKNSGKGVTLSKFGFEQFVKLKSFHIKNHPE